MRTPIQKFNFSLLTNLNITLKVENKYFKKPFWILRQGGMSSLIICKFKIEEKLKQSCLLTPKTVSHPLSLVSLIGLFHLSSPDSSLLTVSCPLFPIPRLLYIFYLSSPTDNEVLYAKLPFIDSPPNLTQKSSQQQTNMIFY